MSQASGTVVLLSLDLFQGRCCAAALEQLGKAAIKGEYFNDVAKTSGVAQHQAAHRVLQHHPQLVGTTTLHPVARMAEENNSQY